MGSCFPEQEWKTLFQLQLQSSTSEPVTEFGHLAEPPCICPPSSVHAWEPKNFVFEFHAFTECNSNDIKKYVACDSHMQLVAEIKKKKKPTGKDPPLVWK